MRDFLPLGTVVRLKVKNTVPVAIIGYFPIYNEKKYQYAGAILPIGYVAGSPVVVFDETQVEQIEFEGYDNGRMNFLSRLCGSVAEESNKAVKEQKN